jgi:hypothetical protein
MINRFTEIMNVFQFPKISYQYYLLLLLVLYLECFLIKHFQAITYARVLASLMMYLTFTEKYYVEEVDTQKLVESAINGMLNTLDPHSVYIPPKDMAQVEESFRGDFEGIGIEFQVVSDTLTVVSANYRWTK